MINLAVINLKELLKKLAKIIIVTIVVAMIFKFMQILIKEFTGGKIKKIVSQNYIDIMEDSLSIFCFVYTKYTKKSTVETTVYKTPYTINLSQGK